MDLKHYIGVDHGGVAAFLQSLVKVQAESLDSKLENLSVFGPKSLQFPESVQAQHYENVGDTTWGLNLWKFAVQSAWEISRTSRSSLLHHTHHYTLGKPDLHTVHGLYCRDWKAMFSKPWGKPLRLHNWIQFQLTRSLESRVLKTARWVVFASEENRKYVEENLGISRPDRFNVIHHGVDHQKYHSGLRQNLGVNREQTFPGIDPNSRWLLFVGNNYLLKGLLRILQSLSQAFDILKPIDFDFLIVGEDPYGISRAKVLANKEMLLGRVHFLGEAEIVKAFGLCDLFLMDSTSEAGPLVLLEAMASGCVPVVTEFGYSTHFIQSGKNGWIVNDAWDLVEKALTISHGEINQLSQGAIQAALNRPWESVAIEYCELYKEILKSKQGE